VFSLLVTVLALALSVQAQVDVTGDCTTFTTTIVENFDLAAVNIQENILTFKKHEIKLSHK
jgi:hypothetical protein